MDDSPLSGHQLARFAPLGVEDFTELVLARALALHLIKEDQQCSSEDAASILEASSEFGFDNQPDQGIEELYMRERVLRNVPKRKRDELEAEAEQDGFLVPIYI